MRKQKRFIALMLVVVMALSGAIMNVVSAAKLTDADKYTKKGALTGVTLAYAIDVLQQLGVVAGTSNVKDEDGKVTEYTFDGDLLVTRQQFALFTARIATALPGLFVVDPASDAKTSTKFKDLVDKTYTPAIDHCYGEGYILGRDEENTVFDPLGNITFAEAVTMLTRALGYTGLVYPTGFMTKASEADVSLIGEYSDFPMTDVAQNTSITRAQMAMLLWNFLLSQRYDLEMIYNNTKNDYVATRIAHPILGSFGIKRTEGYVTAVPNWWANLDILDKDCYPVLYGPGNQLVDKDGKPVVDSLGNPVLGKDIPYPLKGGGLLSANTQFQVYRDICVSPRNGSANIVTTMDKLGLSKYKDDPLELLGLKVMVYEDKRVNPEYNIDIPAIVYGQKIEIDLDEVEGAYNTADSGIVDSLSLPFPAIEDLDMNKADFVAARTSNLYTFNGDAVLGGVKGAEKEANTIYLAQKAANKTNYRLELVYNGLYNDGTPEYFYIFRPFKVGVYTKDADRDNRLVFTTEVVKAVAADKKVEHAANFIDEDITELALEKAYLYTYYGANLDVYAELDEDVGAIPTAANMKAKLVTFKLAAGDKNVYFNNDLKALGAWPDPTIISPNGKAVYTIYYDEGAALLARRTNDGPDEYQKSQYLVITGISRMSTVTLSEDGVRIGQGFNATVLNAQTGKSEDIVIRLVDGEERNDAVLVAGDSVRIVNKGRDYYDVATENHKEFISLIADKEYAGRKSVPVTSDVSGNRATLPQIWPNNSGYVNAYITASTNIVIWGKKGSSSANADTAVRYSGNKAGLDYLNAMIKAGAVKLIAVGQGSITTGTANFVYLSTTNVIEGPPASIENYAMVLSRNTDLTYGGYTYGEAKLTDGKNVFVASKNASDILRGNLVEVTGDTTEAYDVKYTIVKPVDATLDFGTGTVDAASSDFAKFDKYFAASNTNLPLSATLKGGLAIKGSKIDKNSFYGGYGFDLALAGGVESFKFDKNFKVVVAHNYEKTPAVMDNKVTPPVVVTPAVYATKLVTEGRPTDADANVKEQFVTINQTEFEKIINAGGEARLIAYTAGTGDNEVVLFATLLIDLRGVDTSKKASDAKWNKPNADNAWLNPFGWWTKD